MFAKNLVLTGLLTLTSAIDIAFHKELGCAGTTFFYCANKNPDSCCEAGAGGPFLTASIRAIPLDWKVFGQGFQGGGCKELSFTASAPGGLPTSTVCIFQDKGGYTGAKYQFVKNTNKRGDAGVCRERSVVDTLVLEDGQKFNLTGMETRELNELMRLELRTIEDMPRKHHARAIGA